VGAADDAGGEVVGSAEEGAADDTGGATEDGIGATDSITEGTTAVGVVAVGVVGSGFTDAMVVRVRRY
jgi:hypothetical protein